MNLRCCPSWFSIEALTRRRPLPGSAGKRSKGGRGDDDDEDTSTTTLLHRRLTATDLIFYGVGCSVGAGIYSLIGIGARTAGPAIALSFGLAGMACCFTSLAYAEFASRVQTAGSAYTFVYVAFGELCGWLVGWNLTLGYAVSAAVVARSWAEYLTGFVSGYLRNDSASHFALDRFLTKVPIPFLAGDGDEKYTCCPLAMVIIALSTIVLITGVKESARFNTIMTLLNLSVLCIVLLSGLGAVERDNLVPVFPDGIGGMARGAGLVFFSYLGFDMVSCLSEEVQDPKRNMPIGIIGSLAVSMTIYVSIAVVVVGMAPVELLGNDIPIVNALLANACCAHSEQQSSVASLNNGDNVSSSTPIMTCLSYSCHPILHPMLYVASRIVSFGAIFGLTTATFTCLMGQPRIFFSMSKDGLLFPIYSQVNPHTGVPTTGTIITGTLTAVIACLVDLECLANAISLGTLQVFTFVNAGVILLRLEPPLLDDNHHDEDDDHGGYAVDSPIGQETDHHYSHEQRHREDVIHPARPLTDPGTPAVVTRALGLIDETSVQISLRSRSFIHRPSMTGILDKPIWLMVLFTASAILLSATISKSADGDWFYHDLVTILSVVIMLGCTVALVSLPHKSPPPADTFACPMVPAIPLMGIVCNCYMMGSMSCNTWLIIASWLTLGLLFYFGYGIHHSELRHVGHDKEKSTNHEKDGNDDGEDDKGDRCEVIAESKLLSSRAHLLPGSAKENYHSVGASMGL